MDSIEIQEEPAAAADSILVVPHHDWLTVTIDKETGFVVIEQESEGYGEPKQVEIHPDDLPALVLALNNLIGQ